MPDSFDASTPSVAATGMPPAFVPPFPLQVESAFTGEVPSFTLTSAATITVDPRYGTYSLVPAHTATINMDSVTFPTDSKGKFGRRILFKITTSGTTSYTLTFGTKFRPSGTLATGTTDAKVFVIEFWSDGNEWFELRRTGAL